MTDHTQATDEDLIAERIAVAAGDGETMEFVEFYELDRRGRILVRLDATEKENVDLRAKLDQAVELLRDLQNDMLGATGPITWSEDCEMGKKGQPVDMHVAGDIRYRITERAKEKIDAFLATLSDKGKL